MSQHSGQPEPILTATISESRYNELPELFRTETNNEYTQIWRDNPTPEESILIDGWEKTYENGLRMLLERIAANRRDNHS